jgi:hypothetical protein
MLPASDLSDILANLAALHLEPTAAAQILAAVLAPLLRPEPPALKLQRRAERPRRRPRRAVRAKPRRAARAKPQKATRKRRYRRQAPTEARDRALAALHANPDATPTEIAKIAKVSRSTAANARVELAKEQRKQAHKQVREMPKPANPQDRRQRAKRFLRDTLADGPKPVSNIESAASKAHVDTVALEQARADLGVVVSRGNAGGVQAVQWSLPG